MKMKTTVITAEITFIIGIVLIVLPYAYVPKTVYEAYRVPKSEVIIQGWRPLAAIGPTKSATIGAYLNAGDLLNIQVNVTSGKGIDFYVSAVTTGISHYEVITTYLFYPDVTTVDKDWMVPLTSQYDFIFNSSTLFTYEDVTLLVTKQWTETAYRDVTMRYRLLPFEFIYLGIFFAFVGIGLSALEYYFKKRHY
ncbi:MAG: hypothetical protein NWE99_03575 [Candidatus Bathyarchaeota archaeon]|nr:hypothetical protein [Candidatus Bathyarchaeota archaeon]